jgi:hypothetical protein
MLSYFVTVVNQFHQVKIIILKKVTFTKYVHSLEKRQRWVEEIFEQSMARQKRI